MNLQKKLDKYCESHSSLPVPELMHLERETHLKTLSPHMLSGKLQGQLLYLLSSLLQPLMVLEIGTFTGYSTICLAKGLPEGGKVHTIEINPELRFLSDKYFDRTGLKERIQSHIGDAKVIIPDITGSFDMVFIDAAKQDYAFYYDLIFPRVNMGGLILVDNVLWDGKVVSKAADKDTVLIKAFNEKIQKDVRVEKLMLPLRDGLLIVKKIQG